MAEGNADVYMPSAVATSQTPPVGASPGESMSREGYTLGNTIAPYPTAIRNSDIQPPGVFATDPNSYAGGHSTVDSFGEYNSNLPPYNPTSALRIQNPMATDLSSTMSNYFEHYTYNSTEFKNELISTQQDYQIMVIKKENSGDPLPRGEDSRRHTMLNIVAWNYYQANSEPMPENFRDVMSPYRAWENWDITGIVTNEDGEMDPFTGVKDGYGQRVLNLCIKGRCFTYDGWGDKLRGGTYIYVILKKRDPPRANGTDRSREYYLNPSTEEGIRTTRTETASGVPLTNIPFQLSFWADHRHVVPPDDVLQYKDEFGILRKGIYIRIGYSEYGGNGSPARGSNNRQKYGFGIENDLSKLVTRTNLQVYFDSRPVV